MRTSHVLALAFVSVGCGSGTGGDPSRDELNAVYAIPDSRVDDTPAGAPFEPEQRRDVGDADAVFVPSEVNQFVRGVTMPGDLDGDGHGELLLWSERRSDPEIVDCTEGCPSFSQLVVHLIYGGPELGGGGSLVPDASLEGWHINGLEPWVAAAGDLDGDGLADALIGVGAHCQQGSVLVLYGGPRLSGTHDARERASLIRETGSCTGFGHATGVGDLDGDGLGDFVVAALASERAYLFYGRDERPSARRSELDADAVLLTSGDAGVGPAQPVGDVNGDGIDDLLVSHASANPWGPTAGPWRIVLGGPRLSGDVAVDEIGTRIEAMLARGLGDLDGDGRAEIGVTRTGESPDGYVLAGREAWPEALGVEDGALRIGRAPGVSNGSTSLRPAGDVNGDGHLDFLYTDSAETSDEHPRGTVHLFLGPASLTEPTLDLATSTAFLGQLWRSQHDDVIRGHDTLGDWSWGLGDGLAAGSDLDGDGFDEMAIVARGAPDYGLVYLWRGRP